MADDERHEHELLTEWYRHAHAGGESPHEHEHTPEEAEAHEEAAADDGGKCPVCGEIHELAPDEEEQAEQDEHQEEEPTAEPEPEPEPEKSETPEEVEPTHGPPQDEDDQHGRRRHLVTSAWHAHRRK